MDNELQGNVMNNLMIGEMMSNLPLNQMTVPSPCEETCIPQETMIRNVRLATAYVPFQFLCGTYMPIQSLKNGTIFPELYSPYEKHECEEMKYDE